MQCPDSRRFRPRVFNFILLFVVWILLTNTFTFGNILLAAILAWLIPVLVDTIGWEWSFAVLALGPVFGVWAMRALQKSPAALQLAGGRG